MCLLFCSRVSIIRGNDFKANNNRSCPFFCSGLRLQSNVEARQLQHGKDKLQLLQIDPQKREKKTRFEPKQ